MRSRSSGKVRVIAGRWKGRRLAVPNHPGLRPTPDRVRETVFNWLRGRILGSRCLDLFAGSGALGFEAASRGAASVVLVEANKAVARHLTAAAGDLDPVRLRVFHADALEWIERRTDPFDLVFVDPPFGHIDPLDVLHRLGSARILLPGACVYVEHHRALAPDSLPAGWRLMRGETAGQVRYHLLAPSGGTEQQTRND